MAVASGHPIEAEQIASRIAGSSRIVGHGIAGDRRRARMRRGLLHIKPRVGVEQPWDGAELRWGKGCGGRLPTVCWLLDWPMVICAVELAQDAPPLRERQTSSTR
jgi:hypothetical protein